MEIIDCGVNYIRPGDKFRGILERASANGITRMILIGVDCETSTAAMRICENAEFQEYGIKLYFTAGLHPCKAHTWGSRTKADLRKLLKHQACVAVGEVGLSFISGAKAPKEVQRWVFNRQIKLAVEYKLPLYLHKRGDIDGELLEMVREYPSLEGKCLLHCYDGVGDIKQFLEFGFYYGISGTAAMLRGGDLSRKITLGEIPVQKMLLETDAPYLLPENWEPCVSGGGSEPSMLPRLASHVQMLLNKDVDQSLGLLNSCSKTAIDFFSLDSIKSVQPARSRIVVSENDHVNPYTQNYSESDGPLRFLVPDNYKRLGRALRGCGIDCEIVPSNEQVQLAAQAKEKNRILLLRHDKSIRGSSNLPKYFKFSYDQIAAQVYQVFHEFNIKVTLKDVMEKRRCTTCNAFSWENGCATEGWKKEVLDPHPHTEEKQNCKCKCCGKVYWPWTEKQLIAYTERFLRFLYENETDTGDVYTFEDIDSYTVIRNCTLQWRATCQYYNGKPNSCRNGMKCPHRHSRHVAGASRQADCVCVIVYHYRYGILLSENDRPGARWVIPWSFFYDEDSKTRALNLLLSEFGLNINSDLLIEAKSRGDQTSISSGRRIYFEYHIQDWQQGVRGDDGVRPSDTGEDFWLPAIRPFCFQKDITLASRIVKTCGQGSTAKGDTEGSIALRKYSDNDLFSSKNRERESNPPSLQLKNFHQQSLFMLRSQMISNKHNSSLGKLRDKLRKNQGLKEPSIQRSLWETRKSCFAQCTDADRPKNSKIEELISVKVQSDIIDKHVATKLSHVEATQERAETIRISLHNSLLKVYPDLQTIVYGSTSLGICGPFSDVDICIKLPQYSTLGIEQPANQDERNNECDTLASLKEHLCAVLMNITPVFKARVPILKSVALPPSDIPIDITLRHIGHKNTELLREYFCANEWIKKLCVCVKDWSAWAGIRSPTEPMLSSYALAIMTIYCFKKKDMIDVSSSRLPKQSANQIAIFLSYYSWEHNWSKDVICLLNTSVTLSHLDKQTGWDTNPVAGIRDPIELHRNILKPTTSQQLDDIKRRFRLSHQMLCSGKLAEEIAGNR